MRSARRMSAIPVRHAWLGLPLILGFVMMQPNFPLRAASNMTVVADAAKADDLSEVRKLVKERADVNTVANDGSTALLWAAWREDMPRPMWPVTARVLIRIAAAIWVSGRPA